MELLKEDNLRNKLINVCIKKENKLLDSKIFYLSQVDETLITKEKLLYIQLADKIEYAISEIKDLRLELMQLIDKELKESENDINPYILHAPTLLNILNKVGVDNE